MPYRVLLAAGEPFGFLEFSGVVTWPEVEGALRTLYGHPDWVPGADVVWDARAVDVLQFSAAEVSPDAPSEAETALVDVAPAREGGRTAVVTRDLTFASLLVVMAGLGPETGRAVRTFGELEDGLAFLGRSSLPERLVEAAPDAAPGAPSGSSP